MVTILNSNPIAGLGLRIIIFLSVILASPVFFRMVATAMDEVDALNPLFQTIPAAKFYGVKDWERIKDPETPFSRTRGVFVGEAKDGAKLGTVVYLETPGYAGPMQILVAFDGAGRITKVNVFRHQETECHIIPMTEGKFLEQFVGLGFFEKLRLMVGLPSAQKGDIQAMSGGTITSRAVSEAVAEAKKVMYELNTIELIKDFQEKQKIIP